MFFFFLGDMRLGLGSSIEGLSTSGIVRRRYVQGLCVCVCVCVQGVCVSSMCVCVYVV